MTKKEREFIRHVWKHYKREGRHDLPWRSTRDPYRILVSEVMLQQTQVERVVPRYKSFLKKFPTLARLAKASLGDVLREWQGLGYNRRAKMLHECAKDIQARFVGRMPATLRELVSLPGIGPYTAGAIMAFAHNTPHTFIETNIRSVYLHHFFNDENDVSDREILQFIESTLSKENSREWYYALMDYGAYIKKTFGNPNSRSKHYTQQSPFKGSDREIRGAILRVLASKPLTRDMVHTLLSFEDVRIDAQIERLKKEQLVVYKQGRYRLPT